MKSTTKWTSAIPALSCLLLAAGCASVATWASTERASWTYVDEAWGGVALIKPQVTADRVTLTFKLFVHEATRSDSAICLHRISTRWQGAELLVRFDKAVCGSSSDAPSLVVAIDPPKPGTYAVMYDDESVGYPILGELVVP